VDAVLIQMFWKFVKKVVLIISRSCLKMGHLLSKTRSQELKIEKNLVNTLVDAVFIQISLKSVRKVVLMISRCTTNIGHSWSKTRSYELKIETSC
jgi:hypothetical protein